MDWDTCSVESSKCASIMMFLKPNFSSYDWIGEVISVLIPCSTTSVLASPLGCYSKKSAAKIYLWTGMHVLLNVPKFASIMIFLKPSFFYDCIGEVVSIAIPCSTTSIWPLPFGVLLQQAVEANFSTNASFSSSSLHFGTSDVSRSRREMVLSSQTNLISQSGFENTCKGDIATLSSHLIVSDPMEEPQVCMTCFFIPLLLLVS